MIRRRARRVHEWRGRRVSIGLMAGSVLFRSGFGGKELMECEAIVLCMSSEASGVGLMPRSERIRGYRIAALCFFRRRGGR